MGVTTDKTNRPLNPRGNDQSPKGYNRASLFSGKALDFDGVNDYINEQTIDVSSTSFAVSFYVRNNALLTNPACSVSIGPSSGYDLVVYPFDSGGGGLRIFQAGFGNFITNIPTRLNVFEHYVIQSDGSNLSVYQNGVLIRSASFTTAITYTRLQVGALIGNIQLFEGQMAGFKIFNTALTAAQVADLYNNPEKVVPTGVADSALKLWLPMMEGAGTTAYDGSGNGNHGTISGATYVHGIGAPVSQSAVIDWNKGTNLLEESENPDDNVNFSARGFTKNSSTETSPIGTNDAHKYTEDGTNTNPGLVWLTDYSDGNPQTFKVYLKADAATTFSISTQGAVEGTDINVTTEWAQYEVTQSINTGTGPHIGGFATITQGSGIVLYMWHPQMSYGDSVYVPTLSTAQTSEVLLPQGLTTGRDITGVNLFENVRKQGALNLDGNSWAEVHDNASVDLTDGVSLECWVYRDGESGYFGFIGKWVNNGNRSYLIATEPGNVIAFYISKNGSALVHNLHTLSASGWHHLVGTEDGTNLKLYVDGVLVDTDATIAGDIFASAYNVEIGRYNNSTSNEYANQIAQPRIYNRALTAEEVQRNYNAGKNTYTN